MALLRLKFPKKIRLTRNEQFRDVLSHRAHARNNVFLLYFKENSLNYSRYGISVGKKFGNAVKRNRLKRLVRQCCRTLNSEFPIGYDYVIMFTSRLQSKGISDNMDFEHAQQAMKDLLTYAKRRYKI